MMQEVAKLREISFYYKFIEKYACRYEKTKVYYYTKFRVHNVGLLHDGRPEEKSNENEPIRHSIISICILQCSEFFRRSSMSKNYFLCFLFCRWSVFPSAKPDTLAGLFF
jgi:hypothetical protein